MARLKKPVSFAFDQSLLDLIEKLSTDLQLSKSQVLELAINELAKRDIKPEQITKKVILSVD